MVQINVSGYDEVTINEHPDACPICRRNISAIFKFASNKGVSFQSDLQVVYACPNTQCGELFIAYYESDTKPLGYESFSFSTCRPIKPKSTKFSDNVTKISKSFCEIYSEAHTAEELGLTRICGVGYRKALEFLIKDYLKANRPDERLSIESAALGICIDQYISDPRIKEVAKRAVWLGNDETHYQRIWDDKELRDLKNLIQLVNHLIDMEQLTKETLESMPKKKN